MYRKTRNSLIALATSLAILASSAGMARAAEDHEPSLQAAVQAHLAEVRSRLHSEASLAPLVAPSYTVVVAPEFPIYQAAASAAVPASTIESNPEPAKPARPDPMQMPFYRFGSSNGAGTGT